MERDPWFSEKNCKGPFPTWGGEGSTPLGCKADGGGCHRSQGRSAGWSFTEPPATGTCKVCLFDFFGSLHLLRGEEEAESGKRREGERCPFRYSKKKKKKKKKKTAARKKAEEENSRPFFSHPPLSLSLSLSISTRFQLALRAALSSGADPNEVEATGNTPLHSAAFEGWAEGVEALLKAGAKPLASNNAGDRPWHWAINMGHDDVADIILTAAAGGPQAAEQGLVIVQDHVPKVKEFFSKPCWAHHPKPYKDFIEAKRRSDAAMRAAASAEGAGLLPGL